MAKFCILALVILFATSIVMAQETGKTNLVLTVADPTGAAIPNATTHVESNDHSISFGTKTDNTGQVSFELMPGNYTIRVSMNGFATSTSQVKVNADPTQLMSVTLKVGSYSGPLVTVAPIAQIDLEEISITTFIPLVEVTPYPLSDKKFPRHQFKLLPCLVSISCTS